MKELQNLLQQIATITQKNSEILNATGGRFNMFRICGVNHYENTHSAIIAELLNPKGTHSLKSELLEAFLSLIDKDFVPTDFNPSNATVYTEYTTTDKGRIDILIKDKSWYVRYLVTEQGRPKDLDILVNDSSHYVRKKVARHGRPQDLEILIHDEDSYVREVAIAMFEKLKTERV